MTACLAESPVFSVITPVFNPGALLHRPAESILRQTAASLEWIAVDDGSTDGTRETLREMAARDARVRLIFHETNQRAPVARNTALAAARGEFIAFQNHDDHAEPDRLARQAGFLREHPEFGAVVTAVDYANPEGRAVGQREIPVSDEAEMRWQGLLESPFHLSSLMVRGSLLREDPTLRFDPALTHRSDYGFNSLLLGRTRVGVIPEVLVHYVLHPDSVSRAHSEKMQRQGDVVAHRAIQRALPDYPLSLAEVSEIRRIMLHTPGGGARDLAVAERAWDRYLALHRAFRTDRVALSTP